MAAWRDDDLSENDRGQAGLRLEDSVTDHIAYSGEVGYPEWDGDFCEPDGTLVELQDAITQLQNAMDDRYLLLREIAGLWLGDAA